LNLNYLDDVLDQCKECDNKYINILDRLYKITEQATWSVGNIDDDTLIKYIDDSFYSFRLGKITNLEYIFFIRYSIFKCFIDIDHLFKSYEIPNLVIETAKAPFSTKYYNPSSLDKRERSTIYAFRYILTYFISNDALITCFPFLNQNEMYFLRECRKKYELLYKLLDRISKIKDNYRYIGSMEKKVLENKISNQSKKLIKLIREFYSIMHENNKKIMNNFTPMEIVLNCLRGEPMKDISRIKTNGHYVII
jgi:hypothetical protein